MSLAARNLLIIVVGGIIVLFLILTLMLFFNALAERLEYWFKEIHERWFK